MNFTMTFLILRLSNSRDTAASSTHRVIADLVLGASPDATVDFAFLPPKHAPHVTGLFTGRDWSSFDLILATNSFVQEALNLPWLLHANGLPPWASDRPDAFPPVLIGGSNAFAAQCLVRPDGHAVPDILFFGEAEESLPTFIRRWSDTTGNKRDRLLQASVGLDGFWVTGAISSEPIRQAVPRTAPLQSSPQPLPDVETAGTVRIPVGAGCAAFCSFCFEGYERKPYREFAIQTIMTQARNLKVACGAHAAELDAFNLNSYGGLAPLVEQLVRLFDKVSFKSQRADGIAACPEIIDLERAAGKNSFTLGIEGISTRMRAFLSKSLSDADIGVALKALLDRRVRELKLFFILTAHETPEDLAEFGDFCLRLKGWLGQPKACTRVVLSFGRLVRMPNTPLAYDRLFLDEKEWRFSVDGVAAVCRRAQVECRFASEWPDYLGTQLLAACSHRDAEAVVALACRGLSFHGSWGVQEAALLHKALPLKETEPRAISPAFPFVKRSVTEAYLLKRWDEARQFLDSGYCLGSVCGNCGACADPAERSAVTSHARAPAIPSSDIENIALAEADKRRLPLIYLSTTLPADFAGHSPAWVSARLMQTLLACHPELTDNLLDAKEALFSAGENEDRLVIPSGETVVSLKAWDVAAAAAAVTGTPSLFHTVLRHAYTPGKFERATWKLFTASAPREAAQMASCWLSELRLPHTLRRDRNLWRLDLAPAAAKKKCVYEMCVGTGPDGTCLTIAFSSKASLRELLSRLPPLPGQPKAICTDIL